MKTLGLKTPLAIRVVFDGPDFLVAEKGAGIVTASSGGVSLESALRAQLRMPKLCAAHRLDRDTSGLVIFSKNAQAKKHFSHEFLHRRIEKFYVALVAQPKEGLVVRKGAGSRVVKTFIVPAGPGRWMNQKNGTLRQRAITRVIALESLQGTGARDVSFGLVLCLPQTGRTHQIRLHLQSLGTPILGDVRYGGPRADRVYLHALGLRFRYPGHKNAICLSCVPEGGEWLKGRDFIEKNIVSRLQANHDFSGNCSARKP